MKKFQIIGIALLLSFLIGLAGVYAFLNPIKVQSLIAVFKTVGWKTYTNSEFAVSFRYPGNWTIKEEKSEIPDIGSSISIRASDPDSPSSFTVVISPNKGVSSPADFEGCSPVYTPITLGQGGEIKTERFDCVYAANGESLSHVGIEYTAGDGLNVSLLADYNSTSK